MPNRHDEYHVPNHGMFFSFCNSLGISLNVGKTGVLHGKDVRTGAYNLGMHDGKGGKYVCFQLS